MLLYLLILLYIRGMNVNLGSEADIITLPTFKQVLLNGKIFKNSFKDKASIPNSIFKVLSKSHCTLKTSSINYKPNKIHVEFTNSWHTLQCTLNLHFYYLITTVLLLHCHDLKICLRIYWQSKCVQITIWHWNSHNIYAITNYSQQSCKWSSALLS